VSQVVFRLPPQVVNCRALELNVFRLDAADLRDHDPGRFAVQRGFQNDSLRMTIVANGTSNELNIEASIPVEVS
jgi:hypothetical protein